MLACTSTYATHAAARLQRCIPRPLNPRSIAAASVLRRPKARHAAATARHAAVKQEQEEVATASAPQPGAVDAPTTQQQQQASWTWEESDDGAAAYAAFFLWLALGSWPALQSLSLAGESAPHSAHHTMRTCPTPSQHTPPLLYCYCTAAHNNLCTDLPYFLGLGVLTVYIGAHRGLTSKSRQQLTVKEVRHHAAVTACMRSRVHSCL